MHLITVVMAGTLFYFFLKERK